MKKRAILAECDGRKKKSFPIQRINDRLVL